MADTKISALSAVVTPAGTDEFAVNQGSVSKKMTLTQLIAAALTAPVFAAGSASANSWPKLTSGTLLTTPEDGAIEMDADNMYGTVDAGNRGIIPLRHFIRADSARTFTSNTSAQALFNSPANGRLTLETGTYRIRGLLEFTAMSATSGNALIDLKGAGTATLGTILWAAYGADATSGSGNAVLMTWQALAASGASIFTAGTGTALRMWVEGTFEVTAAGTLIPSATMVTASAMILSAGSFLEIERIGSTSVVSVGQWD